MTRPITSPRFRERATLIQESGSYGNGGGWISGAVTRSQVIVVSAPPNAATVRNIAPEGARIQDMRMFWVEQETKPLRVGANQTDGDVIEYNGLRYRIRHVHDWRPHGFVEALGVREDGQDDEPA